jgi:hypothetical protein
MVECHPTHSSDTVVLEGVKCLIVLLGNGPRVAAPESIICEQSGVQGSLQFAVYLLVEKDGSHVAECSFRFCSPCVDVNCVV